jgi:sucrose phosphorylase
LKREVVQHQLDIIRLRNTSNAFSGQVEINDVEDSIIDIKWINGSTVAHLKANLQTKSFTIDHTENGVTSTMCF